MIYDKITRKVYCIKVQNRKKPFCTALLREVRENKNGSDTKAQVRVL
jgi:hypothetical protein